MTSVPSTQDLFPGGFGRPSSVLITGNSRSLLKWFALALLTPYGSRVFWTDVRLPGEILDPMDPMVLRAIPEESVYVLLPEQLKPDDEGARQADAAAATMIKSDESPESVQRLVEFLRMPPHAQELIASTGNPQAPSILVTANAQRLATVYPGDRIGPLMRVMLESGTCQVALWAEAPTDFVSIFDVILHVEGTGPAEWRASTVQCLKGIATGPLAVGPPNRLADIPSLAAVLERSISAKRAG